MADFAGQVVLVTGAGRGIGRAIALAFAAQGATLAVNDLTPINLDETVSQIQATGGQVKAYIFDIAKRMPVQAMVDQVLGDWGRIDILVNCAVVKPRALLLDMDEWDWNRTLDVNLSGAFHTIQVIGRAMRRQGGGSIVNLAHGLRNELASKGSGSPGQSAGSAAYLASQAGLLGLTRAAALELESDQVRINAISVETPEGGQPASLEQVASLAVYLCSPAASGITGRVIYPDGSSAAC